MPALPESTAEHAIRHVETAVRKLSAEFSDQLPFHGWTHISFVRTKAVEFARLNGSDAVLVELTALVHDLNYVAAPGSAASAGKALRADILREAGVAASAIGRVESIVVEATTANRHRDISLEAQALSDADTLFKSLPTTPVLLAKKYMDENELSIRDLAAKIVGEQQPLDDEGIYFYNEDARRKYATWSRANLELWRCIAEALDDPAVAALVDEIE